MGRFLIIRDSREKVGHGWDYPEDNFCRGTKIEKLNVGDYSIEGMEHLIFLDRKDSIFEIGGNIKEKRFHNLIHKAQYYQYKYIVFEFTEQELLDFQPVPWNSPAYAKAIPYWKCKVKMIGTTIHKALMTMQKNYGIKMIFSESRHAAELKCYEILKDIWEMETHVS